MQRISWMERKSNQKVLEIVGEKCVLIDSIRKRRWKMVRHTLRHQEELHNTIFEGMIEGKDHLDDPVIHLLDKLRKMQE